MKDIKKVAVLGASGNMGSLSGGIFAQNHIPVKFFARTLEKAEAGKKAAVSQSRSEIIVVLNKSQLHLHAQMIFHKVHNGLRLLSVHPLLHSRK